MNVITAGREEFVGKRGEREREVIPIQYHYPMVGHQQQ